ncbi:hypothetical protein USB125703_01210 [Pseudoclavibacter triregionum]|nr:hypothetical protein USB125703_01210 [Pseudoclavibacter triregionum]
MSHHLERARPARPAPILRRLLAAGMLGIAATASLTACLFTPVIAQDDKAGAPAPARSHTSTSTPEATLGATPTLTPIPTPTPNATAPAETSPSAP